MAEENEGIGIDPDKEIEGCTDPFAVNYNVLATISTGPNGPYTAGACQGGAAPGTICSGECYKNTSTGGDTGGDIDLDPNLEIIDSSDLFNCPQTSELTISTETFIVNGPDGQSLGLDCCTEAVVGSPVTLVTIGGKPNCVLNQNPPCPPIESIAIAEDQTTIIGINSEECCTQLGQNQNFNTTWDGKDCLIINQSEDCTFTEFTVNTQSNNPSIPQGFSEVLGVSVTSGEPVSLTNHPDCCTSDNVGFDVTYNEDLGLCLQPSPTPQQPPSTVITLNESPLENKGCDDLLVSVKLYFSQPPEDCLSETEITAFLIPNNPSFTVEQLGIFTSESDGFNTWVDLGARIIIPNDNDGQTNNLSSFDLQLSLQGNLLGCCDYDIRIDNIRVDCFNEEDRIFFQKNDCPGFDLKRVIDNKKSWVYNPGTIGIGKSIDDNIDRNQGDKGLLERFGFINRTFAPSADADLPWRYTNYYEQSNIREPHSKAVINSKEMELTFNMCGQCCVEPSPCPAGYTLSAGTETCYKETIGCPDGFRLSDGICISGETCDCLNIEWSLSGGTSGETLNTHFVATIDGKRAWIFDVSGDTHSIEYQTAENSWFIFHSLPGSGKSYQYASTTECPTSTLVDWTDVGTSPGFQFTGLTITEGICTGTTATTINTLETISSGSYCLEKVSLLQLEDYKKTFQSFWVRMIEQFVPATTIFVSGEKWCNNDELICTEFEECDYDYEYVESEITVINYGTDFAPITTGTTNNGGDLTEENDSDTVIDNDSGGTPNDSDEGPIFDDGTTVIPTPNDNGSQTIVDNEEPFSNTRNQTLQNEVNVYNTILTNGEPQIVFE